MPSVPYCIAGPRSKKAAGDPPDIAYVGACVLLLALVAAATATLQIHHLPSDAQLAANFSVHTRAFEDLVRMFNTDRPALIASRRTAVSLLNLGTLLGDSRAQQYLAVSREISVSDVRCDLLSGSLTLLPRGAPGGIDGASKVYRYIPQGNPEPLERHQIYHLRGAGMYFVTGDSPLDKHWFIHHNATVPRNRWY